VRTRAGANPSSGPLALVKDDAERLLARELAGQAYVILTKARAGGAPGRRACPEQRQHNCRRRCCDVAEPACPAPARHPERSQPGTRQRLCL